MKPPPEVIIIGSGPAGVSAAWPLLEAGLRVLMLDQGEIPTPAEADDRAYLDIRRDDAQQWRRFLGDDFGALRGPRDVSPKLKAPANAYAFRGFRQAYNIHTDNFQAIGSLAQGGLSNVWGAGAYAYDDQDLKGFPVARQDLRRSFVAVATRMGISGVSDGALGAFYGDDLPLQPPVELHENMRRLLDRSSRRASLARRMGIRFGRARNAVLTEALGGRGACTLDDRCLWGCPRGAIYSASREVENLREHAGFTYRGHAFVRSIRQEGDTYHLAYGSAAEAHPSGEASASVVVLAAGTLGSTKLALEFIGVLGRDVPVLSNPAFATAFYMPERLGASLPERGFSLGQLAFVVDDRNDPSDYAHGVLFAATSLPAADLAKHMPLTLPGALRLARLVMPGLVLANCFLPGSMSRNTLRVEKNGGLTRLSIRGAHDPELMARVTDVRSWLARFFLRLGAVALPGGTRVTRPGADVHYAGTLPMNAGTPTSGPVTDAHGQLAGCDRLFIADGAVLSRVTAKNPTLTIMANADRIARHVAGRLRG